MNRYKKIVTFLLLLVSMYNYSQLGFCTGSKGATIFSEKFGNGTTYGPALPTGTTNYTFITGNPNDGFYTLFYRTNLYSTWHYSLDHTPDVTDGVNGKALIVNANASTSGDFYKRTVSGLCINTTFEFSAWLMNVYNPGSGFCGASEIPINVRFEIWNNTETVLLGSGNTGNIIGTASPIWQQFALVFTTTNQTSVVLKMKNNGLGGCGNDLAIDDIEFKSCGDLTTISSPSSVGNTFATCDNPVSIQLQATTTGVSTYFYQWQTSTDGSTWSDIAGANASTYTTPNLTTQTYFRTKVAQDAANLSNNFCSALSDVFAVSFLSKPNSAVNIGDATICSNETIPSLSVSSDAGTSVNWYDAPTGGTLLQANSLTYTPTAAGTFYAEAYNVTTNCKSNARTPVTLTIIPLPTASITGTASICSGNSTIITFNGTANAIVTYTVDGGSNQTITLNSSGIATVTTPFLTANSTYTLVSITSSVLSSCMATLNIPFLITVNPIPTASISGSSTVCLGSNTVLTYTGTADAIVTYTVDGGSNQTITLNSSGIATITTPNLTSGSDYTLIGISSTGANACTQTLSQVFTISLIALPTASVTANPLSVCVGGTSTLNFNGTPNAIITYSQNGGSNQTITLNASGLESVTTSNLTTNTTFQLVDVTLPGTTTCSQSPTSSVVVAINPTPIASFSGDLIYCSNETLNISLASDIVGTTYSWTVTQNLTTGATSGSGDTINQVLSVTNSDGNATYFVTPFYNGCAGTLIEIDVEIRALPSPVLNDGVICLNNLSTPSSQFYTLTTGLNPADYSFDWYFGGVLIPTASGSFYNANQIGNYSMIATNNVTGCISDEVFATVSESIQGESLIINQSAMFSDNQAISITVVGGDGPFLYQLDNSDFQTSNVFSPVSPGLHIITVVDETFCTNLTTTTTIINYEHYFTPNGDGINDFWNIKGLAESSRILIFDRFGKTLKQIYTNGPGWDGTYNGQTMPSDDYWFVIDYIEDSAKKIFRAHFTLKR
jgi:gliding motility-associated-like protein